MISRTLFHEDRPIGVVELDDERARFTYAADWIADPATFHLSLSIPKPGPVEGEQVVSWLANLLPEGENLIGVGRALGVARSDIIALLDQLGGDTAGAAGVGQPRPFSASPEFLPIPDQVSLRRILDELPAKPFLAGEDGVSMSLAGVQEKLPLTLIGETLAVPVNGALSTHILKPDSARLAGMVHNEALCMTLARRCGLPVAEVVSGLADGRAYLLVTRHDRQPAGGNWRRLHQEDFCQALGVPPSAKYEFNQTGRRGPSTLDMLNVIDTHMTAVDRLALLDAVIFNVLICNTDAHAKNFSILLGEGGGARLAPLYDLICADVWGGMTRKQAQAIGEERRGDQLRRKHWTAFAMAGGFAPTRLLRRVENLAQRVLEELVGAVATVEAMPAGGHPMLSPFRAAIERRCHRVLANLPA